MSEPTIRNSLGVLQNIIDILPEGKIKDELVKYHKNRLGSLRYSAPEVITKFHLDTFEELSIMLPNLDLQEDLKEKIRKIFIGDSQNNVLKIKRKKKKRKKLGTINE